MNYRETLVQCLRDWPTLYLNQDDVLGSLFFSIGTGYEWEHGGLVQTLDETTQDKTTRQERERPWDSRAGEREWRLQALSLNGNKSYFKHGDGVGRFMYQMFGQYSPIMHLPDDIKPDWLEAARLALEYALSDRVRLTQKQFDLLALVSQRLNELGVPFEFPDAPSNLRTPPPTFEEKRRLAIAAFLTHVKQDNGYPGGMQDTSGGPPYYELDASVIDELVEVLGK